MASATARRASLLAFQAIMIRPVAILFCQPVGTRQHRGHDQRAVNETDRACRRSPAGPLWGAPRIHGELASRQLDLALAGGKFDCAHVAGRPGGGEQLLGGRVRLGELLNPRVCAYRHQSRAADMKAAEFLLAKLS
jgi:hypothetical protein